jgi:kynurenine 3-monooxygenase
MKSHVLSPLHLLRRRLDVLLSSLFPPPTPPQIASSLAKTSGPSSSSASPYPGGVVRRWSTLYHMVTFRADVGYAEAWQREEHQKRVLRWLGRVLTAAGGGAIVWLLFALRARRRARL